ncbi:MAG TPA: DUF4384 domain-containing protein [Burkholderiaceae bacterium]|nr:DUF4384 domain-containing protein [Burkholderiaceae bacterium]
MTTTATRSLARLAAALVASMAAACATTGGPSEGAAGAVAAAPSTSALAPALRCMDALLLEHGVRDLSVIVEDLADPSQQKAQAGTKELLVTAVSDMTQRSRAIRLVASNAEFGQTRAVMTQAQKSEPYAVAPQFALRGTLRVLDGGRSVSLDLTLLTTQDMSIVPGTATHNTAVLRNGNAELAKFGQPVAVSAASVAQAQRALAELAVVELFGRLAKVPYWSCLGANADNPAVAAEIQDWYDAMAARQTEIVSYFQQQLRIRQAYDGPIDGTISNDFKDAVVKTRAALGLSREPKLSLDFFKAYLGADVSALQTKIRAAAPAQAPAAPAPPAPLTLQVASSADGRRLARGEAVQLSIRPSRDAHVYCYLQDEKQQVTRFFPNRFQRDSRVAPATGLQLPGSQRFELTMNTRGVPETVACFATERDVLAELPAGVNGSDFQPLPVATLDQVRQAFIKVSGGALAHEALELRGR